MERISDVRFLPRANHFSEIKMKCLLFYYSRKRERAELDSATQTSSPGGGWQSRLSAFLHVHRGSRASSRKSSRASDASDISELAGPWLNLPLVLLTGVSTMGESSATAETDVSIKINEATPDKGLYKLNTCLLKIRIYSI